jgi:hypothetical protein
MLKTPEQWLTDLGKKLDERQGELRRLYDYVSGNAPLPEGATSVRDSFAKWQRLARTDYANLVVDAPAERMTVAGFRVGDESTDNDAARDLWRRSLMESTSNDVTRDMLIYGVAYAMASQSPRGPILTRESPFNAITDHDPLDPTVVRAGLKVWTDDDIDYAVVHTPGRVDRYTRPGVTVSGTRILGVASGGWEHDPDQSGATGLDVVPMVRFLNRDGVGEFARHTDLLDRINWVVLQRLLIIAMQAYRQRAIKGDLPEVDADGNEIDYAAEFLPGPDALWTLPDGVDIWESEPGDVQQILSAVKDDLRDLSAVTRTPMSVLSPDSANQSAEGAALMREGLVFKVEDRQRRMAPCWDALVSIGLALAGEPARVQVQWAPAERQSLAEKSDAAVKLATVLPWRRVATDVLAYPADEVDRMEIERGADALAAMLAQPVTVTNDVANG